MGGYQSPEIVAMNNKLSKGEKIDGLYYNQSMDIFAMGVVLFILLCGYPPFKSADASDKWYGFILRENYKSFWVNHRNSGLKKRETDLITRMLLNDFNKRITINKIQSHSWYKDEILSKDQLCAVLTFRHQQMELMRNADPSKQAQLQTSERVVVVRPLFDGFLRRIQAKGYKVDRRAPQMPKGFVPNLMHSIYTTVNGYDVLQKIKIVIEDEMKGVLIDSKCNQIFDDDANDMMKKMNVAKDKKSSFDEIDIDNFCLTATIANLKEKDMESEGVRIHVQLYWDAQSECHLVTFNIIRNRMQSQQSEEEKINQWKRLKYAFLTKAGSVLTGFPRKAKKTDDGIVDLYNRCFPNVKIEKK